VAKDAVPKSWQLAVADGRWDSRFPDGPPAPPEPPTEPGDAFTPESGYVVSGDFAPGETFTVTKAAGGFGNTGPTILVYDDFAAGTVGEVYPVGNAEAGSWTANINDGLIRSGGYSGGKCYDMIRPEGGQGQMRRDLAALGGYSGGPRAYGYFLHFKTRIGDNLWYPGAFEAGRWPSSAEGETGSNWKHTWTYQKERGVARTVSNPDMVYNVCEPSKTGFSVFQLGGNHTNYPINNPGLSWFAAPDMTGGNTWKTVSTWNRDARDSGPFRNLRMLGGPTNYYDETDQCNETIQPRPPIDPLDQWGDRWHFGGWLRRTSREIQALYDDIYLAVDTEGAIGSANCRIELINNSDYSDCTESIVCLVQSWSDTSITVKVPRNAPISGKAWRVLAHLSDGSFEDCAAAGVTP
jgi:hypothetical protein